MRGYSLRRCASSDYCGNPCGQKHSRRRDSSRRCNTRGSMRGAAIFGPLLHQRKGTGGCLSLWSGVRDLWFVGLSGVRLASQRESDCGDAAFGVAVGRGVAVGSA